MANILGRMWEMLASKVDSFLFGVAVAIAGVGLITLFSATDQSVARVTSQGTSLAFALVLMWLVANIPPIAMTVSGYDWQAWQGIVAPAGMPKEIVTKLAGELQKIQASADFKEQLVKFGMEPFPPQSAEQFAAMIATEQPRWEKAIKDSGAKVD